MKNLLFLILITLSCLGKAQTLLIPSEKSFEKKWLKSSNYQMVWYALKDTTKFEIGTVTTKIVVDKKNLHVITQINLKNVAYPWIDSTIADVKTLKPIKHTSSNMQRDMILNFGNVITGFYHNKTKNIHTPIQDTIKQPYFDSNLYPILIAWLPLSDNYKQNISIYDYNPTHKMGILKASINHVSSGTYQTEKSGLRSVWIVNVSDEISPNGVSNYYFDKQDRRLWKQEIDINGRKMLMELIE